MGERRNPTQKKRKYWLDISKRVHQQIERLPGYVRQRIRERISALADDPRPADAQLMRGYTDHYRLALAEWRIMYRVDDDVIVVEVIKVGRKHGPEFYIDLE